jgi:hypothetical protein
LDILAYQKRGVHKVKRSLGLVALLVLSYMMTACGGGGGGGSTSTAAQTASSVSGVASKGPIANGIVTAYALNADGSRGAQLGTATTQSDGSYSVDLGTYKGNVLIVVTGGTYTDEATGESKSNPGLSAALTNVSGEASIAVTPMTDIAVKCAGALTTYNIEKANSLVSCMIGTNIINIMPANVSTTGNASTATGDQIEYGLMLAVISKLSDMWSLSVGDVVAKIKDDLADGKLDVTGADILSSLQQFISDTDHNNSGITSASQTKLCSAISYIKDNVVNINPQVGNADLVKAKEMVTDFRNTMLSIYNYKGVGAEGIVQTPFHNFATEFETKLKPELSDVAHQLGWIMTSVEQVSQSGAGVPVNFSKNGLTLTVTPTSDTNADIAISNGTSGTVTVNSECTYGTFNAAIKTPSGGTLTMSSSFSATLDSSGVYSDITFIGSFNEPAVIDIDLGQSGRKIDVSFGYDSANPGSIYPTGISVSGLITTNTAQITGSIDVKTTLTTNGQGIRPKTAKIDGSFSEIVNGTATGVNFTGSVNGTWDNAEDYDMSASTSSSNFPKWNATFTGKIIAPSFPTITATLKAAQTVYQQVSFDVGYEKANTDGSVVFISGNGTYNFGTKILTANLTNQDGIVINFTHNKQLAKDERFSGSIASSGGANLATLYVFEGMPAVKYIDDYFETLI